MCSLNGDHKSKLPRPCSKSNGARASEPGRPKGKPKGHRSGNNSGQRYILNKRHAACGMGQSRMVTQLVTLEVWPTTTTSTAFWRPGGMISMVDGDVPGWFMVWAPAPPPTGHGCLFCRLQSGASSPTPSKPLRLRL